MWHLNVDKVSARFLILKLIICGKSAQWVVLLMRTVHAINVALSYTLSQCSVGAATTRLQHLTFIMHKKQHVMGFNQARNVGF